jgi:vesicle coat complex subunit
MLIIQYIMPSKNKQLKKLLHFHWEVCPKYDENGKLKQEMILVVYVYLLSSYRAYTHLAQQCHPKRLGKTDSCTPDVLFFISLQQHPNEYIRGATLRYPKMLNSSNP